MASLLSKSIAEIDSMEADEVRGWRVYMAMEPRGEERRDYNAAQVCQAVYTVIAALARDSQEVKLETCLLKFKEKKEKAKSDSYRNAVRMMGFFGGDIARKMRADIQKHFPQDTD